MADPKDVVFVVDDDVAICATINALLRSAGVTTHSFASAKALLDAPPLGVPACLVLDVASKPGAGGLEVQRERIARQLPLPVVFVSGRPDIPTTVRAIKSGAVELLPKPFRDQNLLSAVREALESAHHARKARAKHADLRARHESLTPRQREVLELVVKGKLNKQIAHALGISEITVKIHRRLVMRKMHAGSIADLVQMAERIVPLEATT